MQYFQAVQLGQERTRKAHALLAQQGALALPTTIVKAAGAEWQPVGDENRAALDFTADRASARVLVVDEEGYVKAQTQWVDKTEAERIYHGLLKVGLRVHTGPLVDPSRHEARRT